jgi:hypothetical protein
LGGFFGWFWVGLGACICAARGGGSGRGKVTTLPCPVRLKPAKPLPPKKTTGRHQGDGQAAPRPHH